MPVVALDVFVAFAALGFVWRSWEQRRRTGSTGFRGVSGRLGSAEWFAGVGIATTAYAQLDTGDSWRIGGAYRDYLATIGRFVPAIGLRPSVH